MFRLVVVVEMLSALLLSAGALAGPPADFEEAKRVLETRIYVRSSERIDVYCGCEYDAEKNLDPSSCGVGGLAQRRGSDRIWWEHAMPVSHARQHFACYREKKASEGGKRGDDESPREFCGRSDPAFAAMEADMHNLFPSVGSINQARGAFAYGMVPGEPREYGACDFEIGDKRAEPRESVRGDLARAVMYMSDRYRIRLSDRDRRVLEAWNRADPVDEWEIERNRRIMKMQGNGNPLIAQ